jgi:hypothetical protein
VVCSEWNGLMESNAEDAAAARGWNMKLSVWQETALPVFDRVAHGWFTLNPDGSKTRVEGEGF